MASSSNHATTILYQQQIKREHKQLLKKTSEFNEALNSIDSLYRGMQAHENRMKDMEQRFMALVKDEEEMRTSFKEIDSNSHARFEKLEAEIKGIARKVIELEALVSEHSERFESKLPFLQGIQERLDLLEAAVEKMVNNRDTTSRTNERQDAELMAREISSLRGFIREQENSLKLLRRVVDDMKQTGLPKERIISRATTQTEDGPGEEAWMPPSPTPAQTSLVSRNRSAGHPIWFIAAQSRASSHYGGTHRPVVRRLAQAFMEVPRQPPSSPRPVGNTSAITQSSSRSTNHMQITESGKNPTARRVDNERTTTSGEGKRKRPSWPNVDRSTNDAPAQHNPSSRKQPGPEINQRPLPSRSTKEASGVANNNNAIHNQNAPQQISVGQSMTQQNASQQAEAPQTSVQPKSSRAGGVNARPRKRKKNRMPSIFPLPPFE